MDRGIFTKFNRKPLIAASLGREKNIINSARKAAKDGADLIELRIDAFSTEQRNGLVDLIKKLKRTAGLPIIATVRSSREQGTINSSDGLREIERKKIYEQVIPRVEFVDVEIQSNTINKAVVSFAHRKKKKVILSYHDFSSVPSRQKIKKLVQQFRRLKGDIFKIAATPRTPKEASDFLKNGSQINLPYKIFIAMGETGKISRLIGFSLGSCLTYGSVGEATAPGQFSVRDLVKFRKELYPIP